MYRSWKASLPLPPHWRTLGAPWVPTSEEVAWDVEVGMVGGVKASRERGPWKDPDVSDLTFRVFNEGVHTSLLGVGEPDFELGHRSVSTGFMVRVPGDPERLEEFLGQMPVHRVVGWTSAPPFPPKPSAD